MVRHQHVCPTAGNPTAFLRRQRIPRSCGSRLEDEDQILVHTFRIGGTFEHQKILSSNQAMLHARLEMEPITGRQDVYPEWRSVRLAPEKQAGPFADFQVLILLLVF